MGFIPYWPSAATLGHNLTQFAFALSFVALCVSAVGGGTAKWAAVAFPPPQGVSYTRGLWSECTGVSGSPGGCTSSDIKPTDAAPWERAVQALYIITLCFQFIALVLFAHAGRVALRSSARTRPLAAPKSPGSPATPTPFSPTDDTPCPGDDASATAPVRLAKAAGAMSFLAACSGAALTGVFVGEIKKDSPPQLQYRWSFFLWTVGWGISAAVAPLGMAGV